MTGLFAMLPQGQGLPLGTPASRRKDAKPVASLDRPLAMAPPQVRPPPAAPASQPAQPSKYQYGTSRL